MYNCIIYIIGIIVYNRNNREKTSFYNSISWILVYVIIAIIVT